MMTKEQLKALGKWMSEYLGSHEVYDVKILNELKQFGIEYVPGKTPALKYGDVEYPAPVQTAQEIAREIQARGLGGSMNATSGDMISGLDLAYALAELLEVRHSGAMFGGRGKQFWAIVGAFQKE